MEVGFWVSIVCDGIKHEAEITSGHIIPAGVFGAYATVADTGTYRAGNDVALFDEDGESKISGADFARGVVDEIESAKHNHENISFVQ